MSETVEVEAICSMNEAISKLKKYFSMSEALKLQEIFGD